MVENQEVEVFFHVAGGHFGGLTWVLMKDS